ncbi:MAG: class I SAM-dependent methyltransferase [Gemmatimonadota bacterium]|nr:class I SAM-dependent methyltransferase [Gemmatimonadota bacterium]MDQ3605427.1 class I SAM-dependent methyltransferase [Gemmatimonadota bacterium]
MTTLSEAERLEPDADWYERWFGDEYLHLYPHRDQAEATRAVELVLGHLAPGVLGRALDLACGAGRHLADMRARGVQAFGLDLSEALLRLARAEGLPVVKGDMRELPFADGSLSLVTSFFTSFGYFDDPLDDEAVVEAVRRVLRPSGTFALDYLNAARVRAELSPHDERELRGKHVVETRTLEENGHRVVKRIEIRDAAGGAPRIYQERVRLYDAEELLALLARHGLGRAECYGDYGGAPLAPDSPRVIVIGRAL